MSPYSQYISRYRDLRKAGIELSTELVKSFGKHTLDAGARKLGMLEKGILVLDSEDESAVIMDYCIHDVRLTGPTVAEQFLADSPPAPGSEARVMLEALVRNRYSLFRVEEVVRGVGVRVRDLVGTAEHFVIDLNFSRTANCGAIMATRLLTPGDFWMSAGAGLTASPEIAQQALGRIGRIPRGAEGELAQSPERSDWTADVIRVCRRSAFARMAYADVDDPEGRTVPAQLPAVASARRPGRNDLCPCGSGMKYKKCCGKEGGVK